MNVWTSFMDLVHVIGATGCALLTVGFALDAETARAAFYAVVALAFAAAFVRRRAARRTVRPVPAVVDLRDGVRAPQEGAARGREAA
ncbi:hypothetical protein [Kineococcus sp. SYSU DK004]|uniref:hypothetical protein n=1 Tax=Kineococcus sp. SYSU DK004 TaxID=3383125 RepID=UPI003D7E0EB0